MLNASANTPYSARPRTRIRTSVSAAVRTALLPRLRNAARDPLARLARESVLRSGGAASTGGDESAARSGRLTLRQESLE